MSDTGWIVGGVMTSLAFVMEVRDPYSLAWVFFTARFVYGADRYYDGKTIDNDSIESILFALCVSVTILYIRNMILWSIPEVLSLCLYHPFKLNVSLYKSTYVGFCWTLAICVIPQLLQYTNVNVETCIGMFLLITGISNLADIPDIDEDKENNINTIPVSYGRRKATTLSLSLITGSGLLFLHKKRNIKPFKKKRTNNKLLKIISYKTKSYVCVLQRNFQLSGCKYIR